MIELKCKGIAGSSLVLSTIYYLNGHDPHVDQDSASPLQASGFKGCSGSGSGGHSERGGLE
jgi:hypothetical protein